MNLFERSIVAVPDDIDELGHVNNAVWVRWIQDIAVAHWQAVADPAHIQAYHWVITRHEIDYLRPALVAETLFGRTWVGDAPRGARFERHVLFLGEDGREKVKARTEWAMIDRARGRPVRIPPEVIQPFLD